MKPLQEMVFMSEIVLQSKIAQRAGERLLDTRDNFDKVEVWCSIQSIAAAGNVSKDTLAPNPKYNVRGEALRNLPADRKFRNHFEHYDERIEEWFNNQSSGVYTDLSNEPISSRNFS